MLSSFTGGSVVKNPLAMQETCVQSLGQEEPLEKEMTIHSSVLVFLPGESHLQRSLAGSMGLQRVRHD